MRSEPSETGPTRVDWAGVRHRLALVQSALDQQLTPTAREKKQVLRDRARLLAQEPPRAKTGEFLEVVAFLLSGEKYAIETRYVREVYALKELTPVPCTPSFVLGITNVRGRIVSVVDIRRLFDLPREGLNELDKIVIVESEGMEVGIRADAILGVEPVMREEIQPGLPTLTGIREKYLKEISPERLVILDIERFLSDPGIVVNEEIEA